MTEATDIDPVEEIGRTAGIVWHYLNEHESASLSRLLKDVDAPRDLVLQGLGWLAREGKLIVEKSARAKTVRLR